MTSIVITTDMIRIQYVFEKTLNRHLRIKESANDDGQEGIDIPCPNADVRI